MTPLQRIVFRSKLLGAILVALGLSVGAPAVGDWAARSQAEVAPYRGELLYLKDGELWRHDLATDQQLPLLRVPGARVTHLAHSWDRQSLAYATVSTDRTRTSEIVVANPDGSSPRTVVREEEPTFTVGWMSWPNEPNRLIYVKESWARSIERVEEVDLRTGERSLVLERGSAPTASPSRALLAYQTRIGNRWNIWTFDRQASTRTEIVEARWFLDADHPIFSPDGTLIAFVAAGDGPSLGATPWLRLWAALEPRAVLAHELPGVFFDLWVVQPDGQGLRRVAELFDFQPEIAWSPNGEHVAALGALQLQVVDVATEGTRQLSGPLGNGIFGTPVSWGLRE